MDWTDGLIIGANDDRAELGVVDKKVDLDDTGVDVTAVTPELDNIALSAAGVAGAEEDHEVTRVDVTAEIGVVATGTVDNALSTTLADSTSIVAFSTFLHFAEGDNEPESLTAKHNEQDKVWT